MPTSPSGRTAAVSLLTMVAVVVGLVALSPQGAGADTTFTVTKTADTADGACDADCSLREAIVAANAAPGPDTIIFAASAQGTITLVSDMVVITDPLTIDGPGAGVLTIDGTDRFQPINTTPTGGLTLRDLAVWRGRAPATGAGGAMFINADARVEGVAFTDNTAPENGGGAIWVNFGRVVVERSTFRGNTTARTGGAINVPSGGSLHVSNSTFTGNTATRGSAVAATGAAVVVNSTVAENTAQGVGGAIEGQISLHNSIAAGNVGGDCTSVVEVRFSLIGDGGCDAAAGSGNVSGPAGLEGPAGFPATYVLADTSPAVNAGSNALALDEAGAPLSTDQTGATRVVGGTVDMGAVESAVAIPRVVIAPTLTETTEGATTTIVVVRTGASTAAPLTVALTIARGRGTTVDDYTISGGSITAQTGAATVTIPAGSSDVSLTVALQVDGVDEDDEDLTVTLVADPTYTLGPEAARASTVRWRDIDGPPALSIAGGTVVESAEVVYLTFTITLSTVSGKTVMVDFATSDGSAVTPGDYVGTSGTVSFVPGETTKTVTVPVLDDSVAEGEESFQVTLSDPVNATIAGGPAVGTIVDDDVVGVSVVPVGGLVTSEVGGVASFSVVLDSEPVGDVVVGVGSGDVGEGVVVPVSLTFSAVSWSVPQVVTVTGVDDAVVDGDVAFEVGFTVTSVDGAYDGLVVAPVGVTNTDDDVVAPRVDPPAREPTGPRSSGPTVGPVRGPRSPSATFALSRTGIEVAPPVLLATALVCAGWLLVRLSRRSRAA